MKRFTLLTSAALAAMAMTAQTAPLAVRHISNDSPLQLISNPVEVISSKKLSNRATIQVVRDANGLRSKRIISDRSANHIINPNLNTTGSLHRAPADAAFTENFEAYDGETDIWVPDGFTSISKFEADEFLPWMVMNPELAGMVYNEGEYAAVACFTECYRDEWLITPAFKVGDGMALSYLISVDPFWMYNSDEDHFDEDAFEFIGEKEFTSNFIVLASEDDGATWTELRNYAKVYSDCSMDELMDISSASLKFHKDSIDLSQYAGKTIKIAFQYVGADGNNSAIDDLVVATPELGVSYKLPLGSQYIGLTQDFRGLAYSQAYMLPVYYPSTWIASCDESDADFTWTYTSTVDWLNATAYGQELTETYTTDHSSPEGTQNNLVSSPIVTASMEGYSEGSYQRGQVAQAGGEPVFLIKTADVGAPSPINFGLSTFSASAEGINIAVTDDWDSAPLFGYNEFSDNYWTNYTFNGDAEDGDWSHLTHFANFYYATEHPIVYNGGWVHAKGQVGRNAEFTLEIVALTKEFEVTDNIIATAKCKGSDIIALETGGIQQNLVLPFTFDKPVMVDRDVCPYYIIRVSGFHDADNVTYFAPYQSVSNCPDELVYGWIQTQRSWGGQIYTSFSPVFYQTGALQSFSINMDGVYAYFNPETDTVEGLTPDQPKTVKIDSFYDGSEVEISGCDDNLKCTVEGRYGECVATFTCLAPADKTYDVTLDVHGIKRTIHVTTSESGITDILTDADARQGSAFTVSGQAVNLDNAPAGLYIVKMSDGSARKFLKK